MSEQDTQQIQTKGNEHSRPNGQIPTVPDKSDVGHLNKLQYITLAAPPLISWIIYIFFAREWNLDRTIHWFPMSIMATIISMTIFALWKKWWPFKKITPFNALIFGIAIIGGTIAFLLPLAIAGEFFKDSESTTLRQMLLYTTGGLLGVITLSETRRKNDLDKTRLDDQRNQFEEQLNSQKENLEKQLDSQLKSQEEQIKSQKENLEKQLDSQLKSQEEQIKSQKENLEKQLQAQKENLELQLKTQLQSQEYQLSAQEKKDQRDHDRQVHAERRSRYGKAVEHLAGEKPAVRTGGIYALVGLVDEWLADSSVKEDAKDIEAQIIINTLCAYIRSPFDLAEKQNSLEHPLPPEDYDGDFSGDYAKFHEEANLRMSFFYEIDKRINIDINGDKVDFSGPWSKYKFNFDNAPIFYRLHGLKLGISSFKGARFHGAGDFRYSKFGGDVDFTDATFTSELIFNNMIFCGVASFRGTIFKEKLTFHETAFKNDVYFDDAEFMGPANFGGSFFEGLVNFKNANFSEKPYFVRKEGASAIYTAFSYKIDSSKHNFADRNGRIKPKPTVFMKKSYKIPEGAVIFDPNSFDTKAQTYVMSSPAGATPGVQAKSILAKK